MAPVPIEEMIKVQMKDIVSNCMVLGDKRKHLACILTLRTVPDAANLPTDEVIKKNGVLVYYQYYLNPSSILMCWLGLRSLAQRQPQLQSCWRRTMRRLVFVHILLLESL